MELHQFTCRGFLLTYVADELKLEKTSAIASLAIMRTNLECMPSYFCAENDEPSTVITSSTDLRSSWKLMYQHRASKVSLDMTPHDMIPVIQGVAKISCMVSSHAEKEPVSRNA